MFFSIIVKREEFLQEIIRKIYKNMKNLDERTKKFKAYNFSLAEIIKRSEEESNSDEECDIENELDRLEVVDLNLASE